MWDSATVHNGEGHGGSNDRAPLPAELSYLAPYRCSVQVRQKDPPASWGWPASRK